MPLHYMFMRKQMILAILIIAVASRAESELKIVSVKLCPAAYGTLMTGDHRTAAGTGMVSRVHASVV